jgi:precorrin-2 dehydrogenase/sirohydrochlorin ferrochelatase
VLPISLDVSGKLAVIVGGGAVGMRKAAVVSAAGAIVRVVDPIPCLHGDLPSSPRFHHVSEAYHERHLDGAGLVFACAPPVVNARVVADARVRRLIVNSASDPASGDFTLPSIVRSGELIVAFSTGGAAPALARRLRQRFEAEFDAAFAAWVQVLAEVRIAVMSEVPDSVRRKELLDNFTDWTWLRRLREEGAAAVKAAMLDTLSTN